MAIFGVWTVVLVAGIAVMSYFFFNCPAPQMSDTLQEWKGRGSFFKFKEHQVFYRDDSGKAEDDSVLLCIHGYPTFSYDWSKMWEQLTVRYSRVIAPDLMGYGFSDKPEDFEYSTVIQADMIESLLRSLHVDRVHVLAHDYGDTVAQELLHRFNSDKEEKKNGYLVIETMCLLNGGILPETNFPRLGQRLFLQPWIAPIFKRLMTFAAFRRGFGEVLGSYQPTDEEMSDLWTGIIWNDGNLVQDKTIKFCVERRQFREKWVGALQQTKIPLHVIYGPADPVNPPVFVERYKEIIPNPSITVLSENVGHYPQLEDPEATTRAYFTFLMMPNKR